MKEEGGADDVESDDAPSCRLCFEEDGELISPCACRNTAAFVHLECVRRWAAASDEHVEEWRRCPTCHVAYHGDAALALAHEFLAVSKRSNAALLPAATHNLGSVLLSRGAYGEATAHQRLMVTTRSQERERVSRISASLSDESPSKWQKLKFVFDDVRSFAALSACLMI